MAAQVIGQACYVEVAFGGLDGKTFLHNVGQARADLRIAMLPGFSARPLDTCTGAAECLAQQEPQGVEIRATVYQLRNRLPQAHGLQSCSLLGCHPARRSPESVGYSLTRLYRFSSQVNVQEQR